MSTAPSRADEEGANSRTRGLWALVFVVGAVVALAVVPLILGREVRNVQDDMATVLEPARNLGTRLALVNARQMLRFQSFLLTGDRRYVREYEAALATERGLYDELRDLVRDMDIGVRERLARLSTQTGQWHLSHQYAFDSEEVRLSLRERVEGEQALYTAVQSATLDLESELQRAMEAGRREMQETQSLQTSITIGLLILALGATLVVGQVGVSLRSLSTESERRRREAVAARREIDALLQATGDGVMAVDLQGRCASLNPTGAELLGFSERDIVGRDVHDTIHHTGPGGEPRDRSASPILRALREGGRAASPDDVIWRRDGTSFPARWALQPLLDGTDVRGAVLTFSDMSDARRKEEALRRAIRVRDEVVSIVSHDLKNPLGVVAGAADLLLDLPLDEEERHHQARIIRRSAARMKRLTEDLLDVSRIEAGALVLRTAAETPGPILDELTEFFGTQAEDAGIVLDTRVAPDTPTVRADRDRLVQALSNLMTNALKFTPEGGRIVLTAEAADEAGRVAFSVADSGPGIPAEEQQHLFDRFWQANREDRTGSGLGLAIVRGIAEAHGGAVRVESTPGEGSRFTILVPEVGAGNGEVAEVVADGDGVEVASHEGEND